MPSCLSFRIPHPTPIFSTFILLVSVTAPCPRRLHSFRYPPPFLILSPLAAFFLVAPWFLPRTAIRVPLILLLLHSYLPATAVGIRVRLAEGVDQSSGLITMFDAEVRVRDRTQLAEVASSRRSRHPPTRALGFVQRCRAGRAIASSDQTSRSNPCPPVARAVRRAGVIATFDFQSAPRL